MQLDATVIIPTHNHGVLLEYSVRSAMAQTLARIEIIIIGDGVDPLTRSVAEKMAAEDPRITFLDLPKGPRLGEAHRNQILKQSRGAFVAYLCDDDLWLAEHLETMQRLLYEADFAYALPLRVDPDGSLAHYPVDLGMPEFRKLLLSGMNRIPLSCAAHTITYYRKLPHGWRVTPVGTATDLYMFQQFLEQPDCRFRGSDTPTVIHFPSPDRKTWTDQQRLIELQHWYERLTGLGNDRAFLYALIAGMARVSAQLDAERLKTLAHYRYAADCVTLEQQRNTDLTQILESEQRHRRELEVLLENAKESWGWKLHHWIRRLLPFGQSRRAA